MKKKRQTKNQTVYERHNIHTPATQIRRKRKTKDKERNGLKKEKRKRGHQEKIIPGLYAGKTQNAREV